LKNNFIKEVMYMPEKKWNPSDYDNQSVLQYRTAMSMLENFSFNGNERVLDIGCGSGKISREISTRVSLGSVLGLDRNEEMIKFADETYTSKNLSFVCQDVTKISYRNQFDVVVSFWTLSWVPMEFQITALNNIIQSLKENGRLLLMYPMKHDAYDTVEQVIKKPEWKEYFIEYSQPREFITEEKYRSEIIDNLSLNLNVKRKEIPCHYENDKEMRDSINCWLSHVDRIPEKLKEAFLFDVAESYKLVHGTTEPIMYYSTLEIAGIKLAPRLSSVATAAFPYADAKHTESFVDQKKEEANIQFNF
jgi:trans-aconitate methyltransferase